MILIPEIETVLLQPPRTGSTSVKDAIKRQYPNSFGLYRHMERDGMPQGYGNWRVVSHLRNPLDRMASVYQYMRNPERRPGTDLWWIDRCKEATDKPFEDWLLNDPFLFANPAPRETKEYRPRYQVTYAWREQIKSQILWCAGADDIIRFETLEDDVAKLLGVTIEHRGKSTPVEIDWTPRMMLHMRRYHGWDLEQYGL